MAPSYFPHVGKDLALAGDSSREGALILGGKTIRYFSVTSVSMGLTSTGTEVRAELILFMTRVALKQFESAPSWYIKRTERARVQVIDTMSYHREILRPDVSALSYQGLIWHPTLRYAAQ